MPTLQWIGKEAVVNHHREVPFRLLEQVPGLSCDEKESSNLLVQGDNLDALKALLPRYAGQVKCIYIDPPYNTGNEEWIYNDNVNSPEIRRWLGETVKKEGETLDRHDRWLCMMYPRVSLLKQFLRKDGLLFVSIDDSEQQNLRALLDEIFGQKNFVAQFVWNTEGHTDNQFPIKISHEYIVAYARDADQAEFGYVIDNNTREDSNLWAGFAENSITKNGPVNPPSEILLPAGFPSTAETVHLKRSKIPDGLIEAMTVEKLSSNPLKRRFGDVQFPLRLDPMLIEGGKLAKPCRVFSGWANANKLRQFIENDCRPIKDGDTGDIHFYLSPKGVIYYRKERGSKARNIVSVLRNLSTTEKMRSELERMGLSFKYPKPKELIRYILQVGSEPGDLIMDSFAGSGTTGHAALEMGSGTEARKFILIEMDKVIAQTVTSKRLRKVAQGYVDTSGTAIAGTGGGFRYMRLSERPLFNADKTIREDVTYAELAEFVWFTETGAGVGEKPPHTGQSPLLGTVDDRAIFLLYNGILKDKSDVGGNVLNARTFAILRDAVGDFDGRLVVYGARSRFDRAKLNQLGITFHQLPYELAVKSWF